MTNIFPEPTVNIGFHGWSAGRLVIAVCGTRTTYEEAVGEGGTVHITKTVVGGDGRVRREMRFRAQSADTRPSQASQHCDVV